MVAVRTGFPSPMQPMTPMGGPGTFPAAPLPAGQTPVPASMPPMPLAGFPPPPVKSPMARQGSNAPRRRRFGDSLEGMLGRNYFCNAATASYAYTYDAASYGDGRRCSVFCEWR